MPCACSWQVVVLGSARTELTTLCEWLPLQRKGEQRSPLLRPTVPMIWSELP